MLGHTLPPQIQHLLSDHGDLGMFVAMFLESSVIPIPSELVIAAAGAIGLPLISIVIFGALGSTLGAMVGYAIGRFAGLPFILRFGKYIFITPEKVRKAEAFAQKYGVWSVLIGRVLPLIPFKVFSIAAGIMELAFLPFVACTLIGVVPRLFLLAVFGAVMVKFTKITLIVVAAGVLAYFIYRKWIAKK
ncbi:MAG: DedA family protein [Candidatus Omnitrophica bacterium]|nr:DedA family protein [Candidatus Omnitrophota bacterium]